MAEHKRSSGGLVSVYALRVGLFLATWGLVLPFTDTGCQTVRLSGSEGTRQLYPELLSTYSMDMSAPLVAGRRPEYLNDESNNAPVFFEQVLGHWHIGNLNRIRVKDSSFYPEDITGTFEVWNSDRGEFVEDPKARFSCADITYICKDDKKTIRCPRPDFQKILIVRATYGQDYACKLSGCTERDGECTSCFWVSRNNVIDTVEDLCSGVLGNCTLEASDEMFGGNPCDHIPGDVQTYLRVEHKCINVPMSLGCYQDDPANNPLLSGSANSVTNMTIQKCLSFCRSQRYKYAGVVNKYGCRCGNELQDSASRRLPITDCTATCGGDRFQFCGGSSQKMEVYEASIGRCGGDLKATEGTLYSPDFPGPYRNNQNCTWNIQVGSANVVRITTELLDLSTDDSLTIVEGRSSQTIVTVLNGTLATEYISVSGKVSVQFRAGPSGEQQTQGFILRFKGVAHCGAIAVVDDVTSVSPSHGGNFAIGQRATISCKNGQNVTVECQKNGQFNVTAPYCTGRGTSGAGNRARTMWMAIVGGVVGALVLLAIVAAVTIVIIRKRRAAQKEQTSFGAAAYSAAPTADSLDLTSRNPNAPARDSENEAEVLHDYASIRDTSSPSAEPLYAQPDKTDKRKPLELLYAKPMKPKKGSPVGKEEEGTVDNILYESALGEDKSEQARNGEQQGLIENDLYG